MSKLNDVAKELLANGTVEVVIGYAASPGSNRTRPFLARTAQDADRLVFNHAAINNLAVYLTHQNRPVKGRIGVMAKGCDVRAITMLIQECQLTREEVYVIGMECGGVTENAGDEWRTENLAAKCIHCRVQTPPLYDVLIGEKAEYAKRDDVGMATMQRINAMSPQERFDYWQMESEKCLRCYACRQACPMCYCEQCIAEKSDPQWIESSPTARGNYAWTVIRAFHLAGRCVGCNECERACPVGIPLSLLNRRMGMIAREDFNFMPGMDVNAPTLIGTFDVKDRQDYIK
jgi:formate dehydrogenase (coenzyme F420) beta subunit